MKKNRFLEFLQVKTRQLSEMILLKWKMRKERKGEIVLREKSLSPWLLDYTFTLPYIFLYHWLLNPDKAFLLPLHPSTLLLFISYFHQASIYFLLKLPSFFPHYSLIHFWTNLSPVLQTCLSLTTMEAKCVQKWMWSSFCCFHSATRFLVGQEWNEDLGLGFWQQISTL